MLNILIQSRSANDFHDRLCLIFSDAASVIQITSLISKEPGRALITVNVSVCVVKSEQFVSSPKSSSFLS